MKLSSRIITFSTLTFLLGLQTYAVQAATTKVTPQMLTTTLNVSITDPCTPAGSPAVTLTGTPATIVVEKATTKRVGLKIYAVGTIAPYLFVLHGSGGVKLPAAALTLPVKAAWHGIHEIASEGIATVTDDGKGGPTSINVNFTKNTCKS